MNYIVINGKDSRDVQGLMIQSLPPITKPLIRTEVEEVDGVDGDIVTKLGYSAYDKEILIGLHGDFNIDDVISFFDTEGEITFSNEPDKLYRFMMIEQIDFERLGIFRQATVTVHVQPFKYDSVKHATEFFSELLKIPDAVIESDDIVLTANNNVVTITGSSTDGQQLYLPVDINLTAGTYKFASESDDTIEMCVCYDTPAVNMAGFFESGTEQTVTVEEPEHFNYIWFILEENEEMDATISFSLENTGANSVEFRNRGNIFAKPTIVVYGNGNITLSMNDGDPLQMSMGNIGYITINVEKMNAYRDSQLMNRHVSGDYNLLYAKVGTNTLSWTGEVSHVEIYNYSRWI